MSNNLKLCPECLAAIQAQPCAVGVSGGSDSLALLMLLKAQSTATLTAITVDHGLRAEAKQEAKYVASLCARENIPHVTLRPEVERQGNLAANARHARYKAMKDYCDSQKIRYLAIGHTADDQAETYFINSLRGSGVDGLAAMPAIRTREPAIIRPMLGLRREALQEALEAQSIAFISDPSNLDLQSKRVRLRNWLELGEALGFSPEGIQTTTQNLARARDYLETQTRALGRRLIQFAPLNVEAKIDRQALLDAHPEIALRLLAQLCQYYGGSHYKPRLATLENLLDDLQNPKGGFTTDKTAFAWSEKSLRVYAEAAHLPARQTGDHWSHYSYQGTQDHDQIGALGDQAQAQETWREWGISARAAMSLPAIFRKDQPVLTTPEEFLVRAFWS